MANRFKALMVAAGSLTVLAAASPAAAILNVPLPANTYITFGGHDWAWASPCSPAGCNFDGSNALDLSFQGGLGWRLPTLAELLAGPAPSDFSFAGANVPLGGSSVEGTTVSGAPGDLACASAYFSNGPFNLCNYGDAAVGGIYGLVNAYSGNPNVETWLIRGDPVGAGAPEPATWAILIMGFGLVGAALRRNRRRSIAVQA